jgi:TM2 domain-containing membrane protein YozV
MTSKKTFSLFAVIFVLLLTSCSMKKRVYMTGYHVNWFKNKHSTEVVSIKKETVPKQQKHLSDDRIQLAPVTIITQFSNSSETEKNLVASADNTPMFTSSMKFLIDATSETSVKNKAKAENKILVKQGIKKESKTQKPSGSGKSQLLALLLCILIGVLGIHRFYLGYIGIGIVQLLTLGGCGIWALIDLILILTGDLQPKNGKYDKEL